MSRVEKELDQERKRVEEKEGDVDEEEHVLDVKKSVRPALDSRQGEIYSTARDWYEVDQTN